MPLMDVAALSRALAHRNYRLFLVGQGIMQILCIDDPDAPRG
jgi:hypothetical protein